MFCQASQLAQFPHFFFLNHDEIALEIFAAVVFSAPPPMLVCGWSKCALFFRPVEVTNEISKETHFLIRLLYKALPCLSDIGPACMLMVWTKSVCWGNHT